MTIAPLSEHVQEQYLRPFHFNPKHVIEAVKSPDAGEVVTLEDAEFEVRIFLKTQQTSGEPATTIVIGRQQEGSLNIEHVFRIPQIVMMATDPLRPLDVVQEFTRQFGVPISIGGETSTLFLSSRIKSQHGVGTHAFRLHSESPHFGPMYVRTLDIYGDVFLAIAIFFSVDLQKYRRAIGK